MPALLISLIRTWAALAAGFLLSLPAAPWVLDAFDVTTEQATAVIVSLTTALLTALWYWGVRLLERRWPKLGVLLGVPAEPFYPATRGGR